MRIGIDASNMVARELTGIEYSLSELVRHLPQVDATNDYRLYFNFIRAEFAERFEQRVRPLLSARVQAHVRRLPNYLVQRARRWFGWPIDSSIGRCDVVLYHSFDMHAQWRGARVATIHDLLPLTHAEHYPPADVARFAARVPHMAATADALIAVSDYTRRQLIERLGVPAARISVVHHGVDPHFRRPDAGTIAELRLRFDLARPFILFVGTAEPRKNLPRLIAACARLPACRAGDVDLVIAGKAAWGSSAVREAIAGAGIEARVRLLGHVAHADLPALYGAAEVFVLPSLAEGFGMPLLEAMACGTAVAASATTAIPEVCGDAARLFDPFAVDSIAAALQDLLDSPAQRADLVARGQERASQFTWHDTARRVLAVLETAAREKAAR